MQSDILIHRINELEKQIQELTIEVRFNRSALAMFIDDKEQQKIEEAFRNHCKQLPLTVIKGGNK